LNSQQGPKREKTRAEDVNRIFPESIESDRVWSGGGAAAVLLVLGEIQPPASSIPPEDFMINGDDLLLFTGCSS